MKNLRPLILGALSLLLVVGCTHSGQVRSSQPPELLLDGRLNAGKLEISFQGPTLRMPAFRHDGGLHLSGIEGQRFAIKLRNRSNSSIVVSLRTQIPKQWDTQLGRMESNVTILVRPQTTLVHTGVSIGQIALQFPRRHIEPGAFAVTRHFGTLHMHIKSTRAKRHLALSYNSCSAYEQLRVCPPTCLCAVRNNRTAAAFAMNPTMLRSSYP